MNLLIGFFGLMLGSFLNVVIYRVPLKLSVISPSSACPFCASSIKGYDNIPVLSWIFLRGKCRSCQAAISSRYPIVELATGIFFAVIAWKFLPAMTSLVSLGSLSSSEIFELLAFLYLAGMSVALALIDLDTHSLPNSIVLPSYGVGALLLSAAGIATTNYSGLVRAGLGMAILWSLYLLMTLIYPGGMGFGDVKLAGVLGLYLGYLSWGALVTGAFAAFILGGAFSIALLVSRRVDRKSGIPFGPWMLVGAWIGVFFGGPIVHSYLSFFGLEGSA